MLHLITHVKKWYQGTKYLVPRGLAKDFDSLVEDMDCYGDRRDGDALDRAWDEFVEEFEKYAVYDGTGTRWGND
jgi:hypothetical protein